MLISMLATYGSSPGFSSPTAKATNSNMSERRSLASAARLQGETRRSRRRRAPAAQGRWTVALVVPKAGFGPWVRYGASALAATLVLCLSAPGAFAYDFHKSITIDRSKIPGTCGTTLSNYPMMFSVTDPDLAHTTSGGDVTDLGGDDIIFVARDATTCGGPSFCVLDHEIEKYVSTTGELVAWVRIPSVDTAAAASDTVIYINYGDASVTSPTENPTGVWDTGYKGVWHLEEDVIDEQTTGIHDDSTSNGNDGAQNGNVEGTGKIADGQDFDGTDDYIDIGNVIGTGNAVTLSAWVKHDNLTALIDRYVELGNDVVIRHDGVNSVGELHFYVRTGGTVQSLRVSGALSNGVWYHVAGTWDGTTQRVFLNGVEMASRVPGGSLGVFSGGHISDNDPTEVMDGIIDEVRISDTARSACWIGASYNNEVWPDKAVTPTPNPSPNPSSGFYTVGAEVAPYAYDKTITIDRTKIPGGCGTTLTNYPMLFSVTDPDLAHTSSGGDVTDLGGDDIVFRAFDAATCGGPASCTLDHEIEKYVSSTGELVAWVRIPSVNTASAASDTLVYVYYGNPSVTSPTENPSGVWDASYQGVWHLDEGDSTAADFYRDSTTNNAHGTLTDANGNSTAAAGQIGGAYDFNGDADRIDIPNFSQYLTTAMTISGWVRPPAPHGDHDGYFGIRNGDVDHSFYVLQLANTSDLELRFRNSAGAAYDAPVGSAVSGGTWVYVALTYDGNELISYVDGQTANQEPTATGSFSSSAYPFGIGAVGGNPLDGIVDEVRASNTARSACWIGASYNNEVWPDKAVTPSPNPSPNPSSGFYTVGAATAVELVSFTAAGVQGGVELLWETGSEMDNLGFHLYRSTSASGPWERITASLIPGLGSSPEGARYRYRDTGLTNGVTYLYELEDIETTGRTKRHGPVSATPTAGGAAGEDAEPADIEASSVITYGEPEANRLRVVKRGRYGVVVELTTAGFVAYPEPDGSVRIEIADYQEVDDYGLPVKRTWVEAVAGRQVELVSVRERDSENISLRPVDFSQPEVVAYGDGVVDLRRGTGHRSVKRAGSSESKAARVVSVAFQGEVKKALVEMSPLGWDESRQQIRLAKKLIVTLSFAKRERDELVGPDGRRGRLERRKGKRQDRGGGGVVARLATVGPGLYAVSYEEVFGARSRNRRGVEASQLRLSRLGETVAFHLEPASSSFSPGSRLYFASAGADANPYGKEAVYELEYPVSGGSMMPVEDAAATGALASTTYLRRDEHEENHYYQAALMEAQERWMWDALFAPEKKGYGFSVDALTGASEGGRLELWLQGGSDFPESPDHHVAVSVNGTLVGERSWDGKLPEKLDVELGAGVLREGLEPSGGGQRRRYGSGVFDGVPGPLCRHLSSSSRRRREVCSRGDGRNRARRRSRAVSSRARLLDTTTSPVRYGSRGLPPSGGWRPSFPRRGGAQLPGGRFRPSVASRESGKRRWGG